MLVAALTYAVASGDGCYAPAKETPEFVITARSHQLLEESALPRHFDWRNTNRSNFVTPVRNQQLPQLCGSCWAQASTAALSDRLFIASGGRDTAKLLAPQVLLNLLDLPPHAGGCNGGDHALAYEFIRLHGISDESCAPYQGVDTATWGEGVSISARMCRVCSWSGTCQFTEKGPRYGVREHGKVKGVLQMQAEIYRRGPIACSIHARNTVFNTYNGTPVVLFASSRYTTTTHVVVIHGWGETQDGTKYWIGKNSYGTLWGLEGFFLMRRGHDDFALESHHCAWAVPYKHADGMEDPAVVVYS